MKTINAKVHVTQYNKLIMYIFRKKEGHDLYLILNSMHMTLTNTRIIETQA